MYVHKLFTQYWTYEKADEVKFSMTVKGKISIMWWIIDHICGLVVRVPGYTSKVPGFDSLPYQIFQEVVGMKQCPLSLMSTIEELLERKSSGSGLEIRDYGRGDPSSWPPNSLYPQKSALTLLTSSGFSVGIVCSWTKATVFVCLFVSSKTENAMEPLLTWVVWMGIVSDKMARMRLSVLPVVESDQFTGQYLWQVSPWRLWLCGCGGRHGDRNGTEDGQAEEERCFGWRLVVH
jgi:hypothetical protein